MKCKILTFAASPLDRDQLMLAREAREIRQRLREARLRDGFALETRWAVRMRDFLSEILFEDPDVVHLSGHGNERGEWLFEDDRGLTAPVSTDEIAAHFKTLRGKIKVVLFNGCYSDSLACAVTSSVDCAVGIRKQIQDAMAVDFAADFYGALASDRSILTSFEHACNLAKGEPCEPTIYFHEGVSGETLRLLPQLRSSETSSSAGSAVTGRQPTATDARDSGSGSKLADAEIVESRFNIVVGKTVTLYLPQDSDGKLTYYRANPQQVALRRIEDDQFVLLAHPQPRDTKGDPLVTRFPLRLGESLEFAIHFFLIDTPCLFQFRLCRTGKDDVGLRLQRPLL
jgi:hypothetical protein